MCTDPCNVGLCIIMLKHKVLVTDEPQDLITLSLCIQIAIDKMKLCSLSVAYTCPHHNPTVTNVDISKPSSHATRGLRLLRVQILMVEKLTLNYLATALVDIPAVSMPIARSIKT